MNNDNLNIYNNLVKLTRNKYLYLNLNENETFSDRLTFLLIHLSFFLKIYKTSNSKIKMQEIHDFIFKQIELSIREIGYGDATINKKMKDYVNLLFSIIDNIDSWDKKSKNEKTNIIKNYINLTDNVDFIIDYFEKYRLFLSKNAFNKLSKDIITF